MMQAPPLAPPPLRAAAGAVMAFSLVCGLTAGAALGMALAEAV